MTGDALWEIVDPGLLDEPIQPDWGIAVATWIDEDGDLCYGFRVAETVIEPPIETLTAILHAVVEDLVTLAAGEELEDTA